MKIAIATGSVFWAGHLAGGLARAGHECTLLVADATQHVDGVALRSLPLLALTERLLCAALPAQSGLIQHQARRLFGGWAASQIGRLRPDLVIGWSSWTQDILKTAATKGAVVALERGSTHIEHQEALLREEFRRWGLDQAPVDPHVKTRELEEYRLANWITVPSTFARSSFVDRGTATERLEVLPFGVDIKLFRNAPKPDRRFRVLFAGLADLRKGVPYLLQAYDRIRNAHTELVFVGPLSRPMRRLLASFAVPYVHHPTLDPAALATLMAGCSVLALPSIEEGLARVILEAMACGLPVVATENTGARDVVDDGTDGFVVKVRDVDMLADRLRFLRDNPARAQSMGKAGRRKIEANFTWTHYGQRAAEIVRRRTEQASSAGRTE